MTLGRGNGPLHQRGAKAGAVEARQRIDALELDIALRRGGEIGFGNQRETDRRAARQRLGEPRSRACRKMVPIGRRAMLRGAMAEDSRAVVDAGEGFEESRRADPRARSEEHPSVLQSLIRISYGFRSFKNKKKASE